MGIGSTIYLIWFTSLILLFIIHLRNQEGHGRVEKQNRDLLSREPSSLDDPIIPPEDLRNPRGKYLPDSEWQVLRHHLLDQKRRGLHRAEGQIVFRKHSAYLLSAQQLYFLRPTSRSLPTQLNMYDFHKTRLENHENAFKNLMFKKGYKYWDKPIRHLLKDIQRKDYKKNKDSAKEQSDGKNVERSREFKIEKTTDANYDLGRNSLKRMA